MSIAVLKNVINYVLYIPLHNDFGRFLNIGIYIIYYIYIIYESEAGKERSGNN